MGDKTANALNKVFATNITAGKGRAVAAKNAARYGKGRIYLELST